MRIQFVRPLPEIKWSKKGGRLPYDRMQYDNYGKTLRINDVDFEDEGSYDCDATNGVGSPISYSIQVTVYGKLMFDFLLLCLTVLTHKFKLVSNIHRSRLLYNIILNEFSASYSCSLLHC